MLFSYLFFKYIYSIDSVDEGKKHIYNTTKNRQTDESKWILKLWVSNA